MRQVLFVIVLVFSLPAFTTQAQPPASGKIEPDAIDVPFHITGWLGTEHTLIGNLRLTARDGPIEHFLFFPSDLAPDNGDEIIPRQEITLLGTTALTMTDVPKDFQVRVAGIRVPGTYTGTLTFIPTDQPQQQLHIPLIVTARSRPSLAALPGTDRVQLQLVGCSASLSCLLGRLLLPHSFFIDSFQLQFRNAPPIPIGVVDTNVVLKGEQTGYQLTERELDLSQVRRQFLPATTIVTVPMTLARGIIPPDHYTGYIYLTLTNGEEPLSVPTDLSVRVPPFWPFVALLLGIMLGKAVKYMQDRGNTIANKILEIHLLENTIRSGTDAPDERDFLLKEVRSAQVLVSNQQLDEADTQIAKIEKYSDLLKRVKSSQAGSVPSNIATIKRLLYADQYDAACQLLADKEQEAALLNGKKLVDGTARPANTTSSQGGLDGSRSDPITAPLPNNQPSIVAAATTVMTQTEITTTGKNLLPSKGSTATVIQRVSLQQIGNLVKRGGALIGRLPTYSIQLSSSATIWLRPVLALILLLVLAVIGLNTIYMANSTFGAHPISDYFGLVIWGLSADVVSRNLSSLGGTSISRA